MAALGAVLLALSAVVLLGWAGLPASPQYDVVSDDGQRLVVPVTGGLAPPFTAESLAHGRIALSHDNPYPIILNFWATWCEPCAVEMPGLDSLYQAGIPVIGVNVGREDPALVAAWVADIGLSFPIVIDDAAYTLEGLYRINALPTTFFIDRDGTIRKIERGVLTEESVNAGLEALGINE